jgi:serine/threonine protein kinase/TPR repeat protein
MPDDIFPDDLDLGQTIQIPRFGTGQKIFRRYTLQKILGRGGMGVVWLARDEQLESLVALKVLPETLSYDQASLDALKRETKLGLNLAHPNIVRIYDFQQDESAAAISMEYVDGPTLSDLRITKPNQVFAPAELIDYLEALCDALNYAHTREKIVHRDLKPRNLMLNSRGELKIADFGISRSISESLTMLTGKLGSSGSPPYISPQQWDGERPTPRDDIYSVGATLYELLSGKPPLMGVVDWQQVHHKIPPPMWQRRVDLGIKDVEPISAQWEEAIAACLAKDPKNRPQTIRELQARLTVDRPATGPLSDLSTAPPPGTDVLIAEGDLPFLAETSGEQALEDFSGDTIVSRAAFPGPKVEVPSAPAADADLAGAQPDVEHTLHDSQAPADISKDTSGTATRLQKVEVSETRSAEKTPVAPDAGLTRSADSIAVQPPEEIAETGLGAVVPSWEAEAPIPRDAPISPSKRIPGWVWLACAAILLFCSIVFILKISAPPEAKAPSLGDLLIESEPAGAAVTLDQGPPTSAPHTFRKVTFGTHRLTVTLDGYSLVERDLQFDGSNPPKIVLEPKLKPREEIGKLSVRSDPPGALIRLDGTLPQEPPNTFTNVKFGEHHLTAALDGFEPKEEVLPVNGEMNIDIILQLKRAEPISSQDPLQALADERKAYEAARDWPKHRGVSLQLVRRLTATGEPASKERREMLASVIEGLRTKGPALSPEEFRAYEKDLKYAAKLDLVPAILLVADNLRLRDSAEAFDWYYYAAETKQVAYAMTKIAWLSWQGKCGRPADKGEGLKWFKLAHAAGDTDAGIIVGKCYLRGDGTAKDEDAGIRILLPLAEAGVAAAKTLIGQCYYDGLGQFAKLPQKERDRMAKTFYEGAIEAGDWQACGHLGVMHEVGRGVPKDWRQAARLYLQGVEHENPICMYYYARAIELHGAELMKLLGRQDNAETYYVKAAAASVTQAREWCIEHNVKF